jgi:peptide/nickel transport system permease protein
VLLQVAAASVVAEAAIAFLGLGPEYVSWGGLMAAARKYPDAWWLAVFPGAALYFFVRFLYKFRGTAS